jgi:hypothetical protein
LPLPHIDIGHTHYCQPLRHAIGHYWPRVTSTDTLWPRHCHCHCHVHTHCWPLPLYYCITPLSAIAIGHLMY